MRLVGSAGFNRKHLIIILAILVVAVGAGIFVINQNNKNKLSNQPPGAPASNKEFQQHSLSSANKSLSQKKYDDALSSYMAAADGASADGRPSDAEKILLEAEKKIPSDNLPWEFYDTLVVSARKANDNATEKQSLQKAIEKAQAPGTTAPSGIVDIYKKRLTELGVKT